MHKENLRGDSAPRSYPHHYAPHNCRAVRLTFRFAEVGGYYIFLHCRSATICYAIVHNEAVAPQWLLFYSLYAVQGAVR